MERRLIPSLPADIVFLGLYGVLAVGLAAIVLVELREPEGQAWLRRRGWQFVALMAASIPIGALARLV